MDSGAAGSVAPADMAPWPMLESSGSKRVQKYMSACGEKLPNLGQKQLKVWSNEGKLAVATFQCADVTRPLCGVSKICDQGNRVVFEGQGGIIESPNGARTSFRERTSCTFWRCTRKSRETSGRILLGRASEGGSSSRRARKTDLFFNVRWGGEGHGRADRQGRETRRSR